MFGFRNEPEYNEEAKGTFFSKKEAVSNALLATFDTTFFHIYIMKNDVLCADVTISFGRKRVFHHAERCDIAGHCLSEQRRRRAGKQRDAFFVHINRELLVACVYVPINNLGQTVTVLAIIVLCGFERCFARFDADVKFHIGNDIDQFGQLRLRKVVFDSGF